MKKFLPLLLALVMIAALTACGGSGNTSGGASPAPNTGTGSSTAPAPAPAPNPAAPNDPGSLGESAPDVTTPAEAGDPQYGGRLTVWYNDMNAVFDPAGPMMHLHELYGDNLFMMDWSINDPGVYPFKADSWDMLTAKGMVAKDWTWDAASKTFTITIHDNIYFQKKPAEFDVFHERNFTAEDVKYTYDRLLGTGSGFELDDRVNVGMDWRSPLPMLDSIEVLDKYVVAFHFNTDTETAVSNFMSQRPSLTGPEWGTLTPEQQNDWHYAAGTGPFILTDFVMDSHFTFERNDNYWMYDERHPENRLPYLDGVTLQKFADNASLLASAIAGNVDYISTGANLSDSERAQLINSVPGLQVFAFPQSAQAINFKLNQAPFSDINVRHAMSLAINRQEVNSGYYGIDDIIYSGLWLPGLTQFSGYYMWDDTQFDYLVYNPAEAKRLLAEAGYPDGFEFTVYVDPLADINLFQLAKGYFADVGIRMEIEMAPDPMSVRNVGGERDDPRQTGGEAGGMMAITMANATWKTTGTQNRSFHTDTKIDELLDRCMTAPDLATRNAAAQELDYYFSQQFFQVSLSGLIYRYAFASSRLGGLENGEMFTATSLFRPIVARVWVNG